MIFDYRSLLRLAFTCLVICSFSVISAQIVINEYSAANLDRDADDFGKHEDWIELYNKGAASVNLAGWHLSDTEDEPTLWTIGATSPSRPEAISCFGAAAVVKECIPTSG
ncbi:MAG: lamin tail domain-containing protein [Saprospiraceae bacterium]|nr:lamin tail domain-containing protein [Candidatus Opimibacter iunctus]